MPITTRYEADLNIATVSDLMLRQISRAIPDNLRGDLSWEASNGEITFEESDLETLLIAIETQAIDAVAMKAYDDAKDITVWLTCESGANSIYYACPKEQEADLINLAQVIEGLFLDNRRRLRNRMPNVLAHPKSVFRTPKFLIGQQRPSLLAKLNWRNITEAIIANVVSHIFTGIVSVAVGLILGAFFL